MVQFNEIRGFLFDLNGILTDSWIYHSQAWKQIADKLNIKWTPQLEEEIKGRSRLDTLDIILSSMGYKDKYTKVEKIQLAQEKNNVYQTLIDKMSPADRLPGIMPFLEQLTSQGYRMAIASASENAPKEIEKLQLTNYFPNIVDITKIEHNKPAPDVYLKAAEMLGLTANQCVGIDDGEVGIESINQAGAISIGIGDPQVLKAADINFASTKDLTLANIQNNWNDHHA